MYWKKGGLWVVIGLVFASTTTEAALQLGIDLFASGFLGNAQEFSIKTREHLYLGADEFGVGAVVRVERPHVYLQDYTLGAGIRLGGKSLIWEADVSYLRRSFHQVYGDGFAIGVLAGFEIGDHFRVTLPITAKRIASGLNPRWVFDWVPHLGLRWVL